MKKLFYNGEVITVDKTNSVHQAIMIEDEKISFVGSTQKALKYLDEETETIDLCGCALLPGFVDCHIHMAVSGSKSDKEVYLTKDSGIEKVADVLNLIEKLAAEKEDGEWIVCSAYDHESLSEMRHISISELDTVAPENPVILVHKSGHMSVCNSAAFKVAKESGLMFPTKDTIKEANGNLTGLLKETAHFMMLAKVPILPDDETLVTGIENFCKRMIKMGITSSHDAGGYGEATYRSLQLAKDRGVLKNRVYTMLWSLFGKEAQKKNAETMIGSGFYTGLGDEWLKKGPLKLMVDGSAVGGTCATEKPILPEMKIFPATFSQEELDEIFLEAHKKGFQLTAHAAGDKAIEMTLNAYEKAMQVFPRKDPRHRIEHCFLCREKFMPRIKKLGIIPIPNPGFLSVWGSVFEKYYGDRKEDLIPLKTFEQYGIITAFGSDAMVIDEFSPLFGIAAAMERRDLKTGDIIGENQKVDFNHALKSYTYFGAYASFEENIKGSLEVGKLADMVILSSSILNKTPEQIRKIKIENVYLGGESV